MIESLAFDTHNHLLFGDLGREPDAAWQRAREAGVGQAVVIGIDAASSRATVDFVSNREGLWAAVGVHPNEAGAATEMDWQEILQLATHPKIVALGETGLDLYWKRVPLEDQLAWLERHVRAGMELNLPLVLHIRDAFPEAREALTPHGRAGLRAVLHCFGGEPGDLEPFLSWGWSVSFAGNLTYGKAEALRQAAEAVPLDQILVETDAPWLTPVPRRGRTNEPAYVLHTLRTLAEIKGISFEEMTEITTRNAERLFRRSSRS